MKTLKLIYFIIFCCVLVPAALFPPPKNDLGRVWGYPKRKTDPIFEIPTVNNLRIDISHDLLWCIGLSPPPSLSPLGSALGRVWGYPKRKNDPVLEIPTVENQRIDVSHVFIF